IGVADNFITNIQAWTVHGSFEFSGKMQTIEIYTPNRHGAAEGGRSVRSRVRGSPADAAGPPRASGLGSQRAGQHHVSFDAPRSIVRHCMQVQLVARKGGRTIVGEGPVLDS